MIGGSLHLTNMYAKGICYGRKRPFSFNANLVPAIMIDGSREPICRSCVGLAERTSSLPQA